MFAYCLNNPVRRRDASGDTSEDIFDGDGNPTTNDDKRFDGGKAPNGGSNSGGVGNSLPSSSSGLEDSTPRKIDGVDYAGKSGNTHVHHVVEQCQGGKSGFRESQIQGESNKVRLDQDVHRKVSGYYSSKTYFSDGLRVRNWLAGQSFEAQTAFGWRVVNYYYFQTYN